MSFSRTIAAVFAAAGVAAAALAAPHAAVAAGANVCGLVTAPEATAAMGAASLPGKLRVGKRSTSCRWYSADRTKNVFVQTIGADDMQGALQLGGKKISGIGDDAVWAAGSLFVKKGGKYMQVGLYRTAGSMQTMDAQIVPLGKAAAGRM